MKQPEKTFNTGYKILDRLFKFLDTHPYAIEAMVFNIAMAALIVIMLLLRGVFK